MAGLVRASARRCWSTWSTTGRRTASFSGSFVDYAMPRADDMPELDLVFIETPAEQYTGREGRQRDRHHRPAGRDR